jgi:hypothetical protein
MSIMILSCVLVTRGEPIGPYSLTFYFQTKLLPSVKQAEEMQWPAVYWGSSSYRLRHKFRTTNRLLLEHTLDRVSQAFVRRLRRSTDLRTRNKGLEGKSESLQYSGRNITPSSDDRYKDTRRVGYLRVGGRVRPRRDSTYGGKTQSFLENYRMWNDYV